MLKLIIINCLLVWFAMNATAQDKTNAAADNEQLIQEIKKLEKEKQKQQPKATYQVGAAKVTVWENKRNGKNGEFTVKNFEITKVYQKDGQWKSTNHFDEKELLELKAAIDKAIGEEGVKVKEEKK